MHLQRSALAVVLAPLAVVLAPLALAGAAGGTQASCVPAAATTLRSAGAARIYSEGSVLYGCLGARQTRLGPLRGTLPSPATRIVLYALSSGYAGVDTLDMGTDTASSTVSLVSLRTGATIAAAPATTPELRAESFATVTSMAVNATGTLAWIGERGAIGVTTPTFEVHALNAARSRLLASSATIAPKSIGLRGRKLSWRDGGHTRSATL
jgi:hypothetical protein